MMWIIIGAIALFILYFVMKSKSDNKNTEETTLAQTTTTLEKTAKAETSTPAQEATTTETETPAEPTTQAKASKQATPKVDAPAKSTESASSDQTDYTNQYETLSSTFGNAKEFTLFDTKASFFWNAGDNTVTLLSITAFVKGAAKSSTYGTYSFNITDWVWDGEQPKGCATEIKKHLGESFKKGATA